MVLLESMWSPRKGSLCGKTEDGKEIGLGLPNAHSETFYTRAIKERDMNKAWERDTKKFRNELLITARYDAENYYHISEKYTDNTIYSITFAYLKFKI